MYQPIQVTDSLRDRYKLYQKEAQVISINSTDSTVVVSVPSLMPNFMNIQMSEYQTMYYQMQSMRFQNTFSNILSGDRIHIKISLGFNQETKTSALVDNQDGPYMAIPADDDVVAIRLSERNIPTDNVIYADDADRIPDHNNLINSLQLVDKTMTAQEMVIFLNQYIASAAAGLVYVQYAGVSLTTLQQNLIYFAATCEFVYNADTGKMGVTITNSTATYTYSEYSTADDLDEDAELLFNSTYNYRLSCVYVELYSDYAATASAQKRMKSYFGMSAFDSTQFDSPNATPLYYTNFGIGGFTPQALLTANALTYFKNNTAPTDAADAYYTAYQTYYKLLSIDTNNSMIPTYLNSYTDYASLPMNVLRYSSLYVRTSLNTNFWDYTGSKANILSIVPITTGITQIGNHYEQITRIYQAKDPNAHSFTLTFTDEDGALVTFNDPYILNIAVFYANQEGA